MLFVLVSLTSCNSWSTKTSSLADSVIVRGAVGSGQAAVRIKLPANTLRFYHPGDTLRCAPAIYDPTHLGNLFIQDSSGRYPVAIQSLIPVLR